MGERRTVFSRQELKSNPLSLTPGKLRNAVCREIWDGHTVSMLYQSSLATLLSPDRQSNTNLTINVIRSAKTCIRLVMIQCFHVSIFIQEINFVVHEDIIFRATLNFTVRERKRLENQLHKKSHTLFPVDSRQLLIIDCQGTYSINETWLFWILWWQFVIPFCLCKWNMMVITQKTLAIISPCNYRACWLICFANCLQSAREVG